jgi:hypothetical protein
MNAYIEKALLTYCDTTQTFTARQIAYATLSNAGFTDKDLRIVLETGLEELPVTIFLA